MKDYLAAGAIVLVLLFLGSIPVAMAIGKYQVCKNYYPEISKYACFFTELPPTRGGKK